MFTIILGIGVTLLNGTVYNMNKPGYSFNAILSSPSFISIFLAVESTFCIYSLYIKKEANLDIILHCGVLSFSPLSILWKENGVLDFCCDTDPTVIPKVVRECENHFQNSFHARSIQYDIITP